VFLLNATSFIAVMLVVYRWNRQRATSRLPAEHVISAMRAGIRYVRNAPSLQAVLVRSGELIVCAAGLWALLPLVARDQLGLGATGYGVLLGCLGIGAVTGATLLPRIKRKFSLDMLVTGATVVFAVATAALAYVQNVFLVGAAMVAGGIASPDSGHVEAAAGLALAMKQEIERFNAQYNTSMRIRVGINTGPVVAGVIGRKTFAYDLWGDTVNIACQLESLGPPGAIQVSEITFERLKAKYRFDGNHRIATKGGASVIACRLCERL